MSVMSQIAIQSLKLSKDHFATLDDAAAWMHDRGFSVDDRRESGGYWVFIQNRRELFDEGSLGEMQLFEGVKAVTGLKLRDDTFDFFDNSQ